jgi:aminoglycoside phosphotransferase (APT) family kinase protein
MPWSQAPDRIHHWVQEQLGAAVTETVDQVGGMSPGCATRLGTADGRRAFVKAVGPELNPQTPDLFRHEARVLDHLGEDPLWAGRRAVLDESDGWVALLLEDVAGVHPDPDDPAHRDLVLAATDRLADRLEGRADGLEITAAGDGLRRWGSVWGRLEEVPPDLLPRAVRDHAPALRACFDRVVEAAEGGSVVHHDIRNDNLLLRPDRQVVFVDWGMSRRGPRWLDPLVARLEWVDQPHFDVLVHRSPALRDLGDTLVTAFLAGLGAWLALRSLDPPAKGLPTLSGFRRRESARALAGVARRLG